MSASLKTGAVLLVGAGAAWSLFGWVRPPAPAEQATSSLPAAAHEGAGEQTGAVRHHASGSEPFSLRVDGPGSVSRGQTIEVALVLERAEAFDAAVKLTVSLPAGAALVEGRLDDVLEFGAETTARRSIKVRFDEVPSGDIVATASVTLPGRGMSSRVAYRFGRPEPKLEQPARVDAPIVVGGRSLGRPIVVKR